MGIHRSEPTCTKITRLSLNLTNLWYIYPNRIALGEALPPLHCSALLRLIDLLLFMRTWQHVRFQQCTTLALGAILLAASLHSVAADDLSYLVNDYKYDVYVTSRVIQCYHLPYSCQICAVLISWGSSTGHVKYDTPLSQPEHRAGFTTACQLEFSRTPATSITCFTTHPATVRI